MLVVIKCGVDVFGVCVCCMCVYNCVSVYFYLSLFDATAHLYKISCPFIGPALLSNDEKRHIPCCDDDEIWHVKGYSKKSVS